MNKVGIIVITAALAALAAGVFLRLDDPFEVKRLVAEPTALPAWDGVAKSALERVAKGTKYERRWQVGHPPRDDMLSLVLIDSERLAGQKVNPALVDNCTYTGRDTLIICDVALVRKFLAERDLDKRSVSSFDADGHVIDSKLQSIDQDSLQVLYRMMLEWILGHELGHILNGDGRTHFTSGRLEDPVNPASINQARELAADGFLAQQYDGQSGEDFYFFLISILQSEINRKACPDRSPRVYCPNIQVGVLIFSPNDYVRYSRKGTHPEFIIRMDRLLILADEKHDLGIIGPLARGLKEKLLEEGAPRPSS